MALLLNQAQAKAVYDAMVAINNVGGQIRKVEIRDHLVSEVNDHITVFEFLDGQWEPGERYAGQQAFATAYGIR